MNSFVVKGRQCAIIDGVCGWDGVPETLFDQLEKMSIELRDIRYAILNHLEPDHTGWLAPFTKIHRDFAIYASPRGLEMVKSFYGWKGEVQEVTTGKRLELGGGKSLEFYEIPNVHWPETIATFEPSTGTLFPCDAFSVFGSLGQARYDDQLSEQELRFFEEEGLRYFANILASFSTSVVRAIRSLKALKPRIIAPAHGPVWRADPGRIVSLYERFSGYSLGPAEPEITVIWGSMYGMTERGLQAVLEGIREEGLAAHSFRVPQQHISFILASAWKSTGIVIGSPTYEYRLFPPVAAAIDELGRKHVARKKAFSFGSYGWASGGHKELNEISERYRLQWEFLDPVEFKGYPDGGALESLRRRGRELASTVKRACAV
jgi:flavorubredoxin